MKRARENFFEKKFVSEEELEKNFFEKKIENKKLEILKSIITPKKLQIPPK